MYRFHFSYKNLSKNEGFLRGANIILEKDDIVEAARTFVEQYPNAEVEGLLKTKEVK